MKFQNYMIVAWFYIHIEEALTKGRFVSNAGDKGHIGLCRCCMLRPDTGPSGPRYTLVTAFHFSH